MSSIQIKDKMQIHNTSKSIFEKHKKINRSQKQFLYSFFLTKTLNSRHNFTAKKQFQISKSKFKNIIN